MNTNGLISWSAMMGVMFASRVWAKWRVDKRNKAALTTPLVDGALLESVFVPHLKEGDDPDLLAEMRDTFAHLNRRAYAEEFWGLHTQLVQLNAKLGTPQRATLRRALLRLLLANDRWLQLVAAKTCAALDVKEAINPIRALLELDTSADADVRYREELEGAYATLTGQKTSPD